MAKRKGWVAKLKIWVAELKLVAKLIGWAAKFVGRLLLWQLLYLYRFDSRHHHKSGQITL